MYKVSLEVSYGQISVFDPSLNHPFNDWTDEHVSQGFAWRPGSVSFGTLEHAGTLVAGVLSSQAFDEASSAALRVIAVPFSVPEHGEIELATIGESVSMELPPGDYELTFEHGMDADRQMWARFYFLQVPAAVLARVLRADDQLSPPAQLVMSAEPA